MQAITAVTGTQQLKPMIEQTTLVIVEAVPFVAEALRASLATDPQIRVRGVYAESDARNVEAIARLAPDVVLLDCHTTRPEAIKRLRSLLPSVRLVAMTLHPSGREQSAVLSAGASAYVTKNCGLAQLRRLIRGEAPT